MSTRTQSPGSKVGIKTNWLGTPKILFLAVWQNVQIIIEGFGNNKEIKKPAYLLLILIANTRIYASYPPLLTSIIMFFAATVYLQMKQVTCSNSTVPNFDTSN